MDGEEILSTFYDTLTYERAGDHWRIPYNADRFRGLKAVNDLIDADTGEVVVEAGRKITARQARQLAEKGLKAIRATEDDLYGSYLAEDVVNYATGEIYLEAGDEIDEKTLKVLLEAGQEEIRILDIDHVNVGGYIRNTLAVDKNESRQDALFDIYRVMRPGEPPTMDTAEAMFNSLFFDPERYDLSAVGRVKMNMRLELDCPDTVRVLRKDDIIAVVRTLVELRDGKGEIDDIDNLGNRDQGAHVLDRDRHGHAAGPDQRQAGGRGRARVLRLLAAVAVHGPDQPAFRDHAQASSLGARARRPDP
jgi:DNA-directed RNA polymerase subunit beta